MTHPETITQMIKLDTFEFDDRLESTAFLDWLDKLDEFFERYNMSDTQRISMARIKLVAWFKVAVSAADSGGIFHISHSPDSGETRETLHKGLK